MILLILGVCLLTLCLEWRNKLDSNEVLAKLGDLKTSVDALVALPSNPPPVDLQPIGDAVDALKTEIDNKLTALAG